MSFNENQKDEIKDAVLKILPLDGLVDLTDWINQHCNSSCQNNPGFVRSLAFLLHATGKAEAVVRKDWTEFYIKYLPVKIQEFDELFIDYIQSYFFKHPEQIFTQQNIFDDTPPFYRDQDMVKAALHVLMMRKSIIQDRSNGDTYKASKDAMSKIDELEKRSNRIRELEVDLNEKNKKNYYLPHIIAGISILVALIGASPDIIKFFKEDSKDIRAIQTELSNQNTRLQSIEKAAEGINSALQKAVSDSFYQKH